MSRYQSSQKWRRVRAGWYQSPDAKYAAWRPDLGQAWNLYARAPHYGWDHLSTFVTLADCQEHAERLERGQQAAWWGFREGAKKANDASV